MKTWAFVALLFICLIEGDALGMELKKSVYITGIQNEQTHDMAKEVIREAYQGIGYDVRFEFFPGQRTLVMANSGESDGDIARIELTEEKWPNLIVVPTPIFWFKGVAFSKNIHKKINQWKDLEGLRIGIIRGIRYSEIGTRGLSPFFAEDMTHLFKLLDQDRIQVAIAVLKAGQMEISRNFQKSGIHIISEVLYSGLLYHYVNKKNQDLVPELNTVLQRMEKQGKIEKISNLYLPVDISRKSTEKEAPNKL